MRVPTLCILLLLLTGCPSNAIQVVDGPAVDNARIEVDYDDDYGVRVDNLAAAHVALNIGNISGVLVGATTFGDDIIFGYQSIMISFATYLGLGADFNFDTQTGYAEFCMTVVVLEGKQPYRACWPVTIGERDKPTEKFQWGG